MRLIPNIRYGTERYPEKVARRLRAFNFTVWLAAIVPSCMVFVRFFDGKLRVAAMDVLVAATYVSMPLLHRFGPLVAPLVFVVISYSVMFWVASLVGTNGEERLGFLVATALGILIIGTEHYLITAALGVVSVAIIIVWNKNANGKGTEDVEEEDTPEDSLNSLGDIAQWILGCTSCNGGRMR